MRNLDKIAAAIEAAKIELEDTIIYQATVFPETHDSEGRIIAPEEVWIYGGCSQEAWDRAFLEGSFSLNHLVVYRYQTRNPVKLPDLMECPGCEEFIDSNSLTEIKTTPSVSRTGHVKLCDVCLEEFSNNEFPRRWYYVDDIIPFEEEVRTDKGTRKVFVGFRNEPEVPIIKTETNSEESEPYNPEEKICQGAHEDCANSNPGEKCIGYEQKQNDTKPEYCPAVGGYCSNPYHQLNVDGCLDRQPDDWNGRCIY